MKYIELYKILEDKNNALFKEKASFLVKEENAERKRYKDLLIKFKNKFNVKDDDEVYVISSPGRTEICGNHTDHQHGTVVCAALNIDNVCIIKKENDNIVRFLDDKFDIKDVNLNDLNKNKNEENTAESIVRGVASRLKDLNYNIGGFSAYCDSEVFIGSGISSSACFENMIVEIFSALYNDDKIEPVERAIIGRYAENVFFGKPCGLMDQMSISVGGFTTIDFKDINNPKITKNDFSFSDYGYELMIVNTNSSHANLSGEYAAMPNEMKEVARFFNKEVLIDVDESEFYKNIDKIRESIKNDRALLRAIHFFNENKRAKEFTEILKKPDVNKIINIMRESARSSYEYLQNVYVASDIKNQALSLALSIADHIIADDIGVMRVHGGGLSGTIQIVVKKDKTNSIIEEMERVFGKGAVNLVNTRNIGTVRVF